MPIQGLIDTGADISVLPLDYVVVLGFDHADIESGEDSLQVQGLVQTWHFTSPLSVVIGGLEKMPFELNPILVDGAISALWGRRDFLRRWRFQHHEEDQMFAISPAP